MPPVLLDQQKFHTLNVMAINDHKKEFNSKNRGLCNKYQIVFEGGYTAEYCPQVGKFSSQIESGKPLTFRIAFRGAHGDEIEPAYNDGSATQPGDIKGPAVDLRPPPTAAFRSLTNVHTTLPYISLTMAMRYHSEVNHHNPAGQRIGSSLSDVFATAEEVERWLFDKLNNSQ